MSNRISGFRAYAGLALAAYNILGPAVANAQNAPIPDAEFPFTIILPEEFLPPEDFKKKYGNSVTFEQYKAIRLRELLVVADSSKLGITDREGIVKKTREYKPMIDSVLEGITQPEFQYWDADNNGRIEQREYKDKWNKVGSLIAARRALKEGYASAKDALGKATNKLDELRKSAEGYWREYTKIQAEIGTNENKQAELETQVKNLEREMGINESKLKGIVPVTPGRELDTLFGPVPKTKSK